MLLSTYASMMVYVFAFSTTDCFHLILSCDIDDGTCDWWCVVVIGLYHLTGLVHVSEVSWDYVQDVRDVLRDGDEVRVIVTNVDK